MVFHSPSEGRLARSEARVLLREGAGGGAWDEDGGGTGLMAPSVLPKSGTTTTKSARA